MFTPDHEIWKFAYAGDELDDWLPYAADLVATWTSQSQNEVKFKTTFEIILASLLLMDDLLPPSARKAFAVLTAETITEIENKKVVIECLHITPPPPGRKEDTHFRAQVLFAVQQLLKTGLSKTEAYEAIATKHHKSPDTIRRMYERALKRRRDHNRGN
ncbi:hypothetical protein [Thiohalobacter thiocyanaticus]|uniref:hypothetical protein n=1 Tax=Thiohalobacter thiocyanaticus TaxID=585455 RepID=UPI001319C1A4|nr:hypothetical protein [Thiohalobacter thiocyanaticus]